jgi:NAD+ synthase
VIKIERMLYLAEYKRRQAAPGVKVTLRNFGRDRRYPIVNRFLDKGTPIPQSDGTLVSGSAMAKAGAADF